MVICFLNEALYFRRGACKSTYNSNARKVLAHNTAHCIKSLLNRSIHWKSRQHNRCQHKNKRNNSDPDHDRKRKIQKHGRDNASDADKRSPENKTDQHRYRNLQLINVVGNTGRQSVCPQLIQIRKRQVVHMCKKCTSDARTKSLRCD